MGGCCHKDEQRSDRSPAVPQETETKSAPTPDVALEPTKKENESNLEEGGGVQSLRRSVGEDRTQAEESTSTKVTEEFEEVNEETEKEEPKEKEEKKKKGKSQDTAGSKRRKSGKMKAGKEKKVEERGKKQEPGFYDLDLLSKVSEKDVPAYRKVEEKGGKGAAGEIEEEKEGSASSRNFSSSRTGSPLSPSSSNVEEKGGIGEIEERKEGSASTRNISSSMTGSPPSASSSKDSQSEKDELALTTNREDPNSSQRFTSKTPEQKLTTFESPTKT